MWRAVLVLVVVLAAGCQFQPQLGVDAGREPDAAKHDAPIPPGDMPRDMAIGSTIKLERSCVVTNNGSHSAVSCTPSGAQRAGDLNVVVVSWSTGNATSPTVSDLDGNLYVQQGGMVSLNNLTQSIYYAPNIHGGVNTVTAIIGSTVSSPKIRVFEYSGLATTNPVDVSSNTSAHSDLSDSGALTTSGHDLIFAANVAAAPTTGPDPQFTQRDLSAGDISEDREVVAPGSYHATAPLGFAEDWIMHAIAFKAQ